jgi:hypothetical protein
LKYLINSNVDNLIQTMEFLQVLENQNEIKQRKYQSKENVKRRIINSQQFNEQRQPETSKTLPKLT